MSLHPLLRKALKILGPIVLEMILTHGVKYTKKWARKHLRGVIR